MISAVSDDATDLSQRSVKKVGGMSCCVSVRLSFVLSHKEEKVGNTEEMDGERHTHLSFRFNTNLEKHHS